MLHLRQIPTLSYIAKQKFAIKQFVSLQTIRHHIFFQIRETFTYSKSIMEIVGAFVSQWIRLTDKWETLKKIVEPISLFSFDQHIWYKISDI